MTRLNSLILLMIFANAIASSWLAYAKVLDSANQRKRGATAPLLEEEIDLDTMEGVDELTRLVLLKTDSLPGKSDRLDARYLNSLMETLYTGLRKPFKSVSADILGIFPTLEFLNISCELSNSRTTPDGGTSDVMGQSKDNIRRRSPAQRLQLVAKTDSNGSASAMEENYAGPMTDMVEPNNYGSNHKSSIQVCQAVTNDCLSMNDLVRILPPSVINSNSILTRLCPVILFRLMSNICRHDTELISAAYQTGRSRDDVEANNQMPNKEAINLNTLQILKNLRNSDEVNNKRPQKLHKKLKTQTNYQNNVNINTGGLKQHRVDEQLLKIKLKLSEPSIEKVWIFSLLFVILSIVVSMGGLIVLPFVKKTTRRRILTLFEGLAVGGLTGSATLHMFPQAFGLVDENYHRYFWRIFVVFLGIYLCYLCERTIKILKVVRAKMRRRSRASLIDMDFRYGFPSISRDVGARDYHYVSQRIAGLDYKPPETASLERSSKTKGIWCKRRQPETPESYEMSRSEKSLKVKKRLKKSERGLEETGSLYRTQTERTRSKKAASKTDGKQSNADWQLVENDTANANNASGCESLNMDQSMAPTKQRLVRCLKSVRSQFTPVYVVSTQPTGETESRTGRLRNSQEHRVSESQWHSRSIHGPRRNRLLEDQHPFRRPHEGGKLSSKRQAKHEEMETMLYHRNLIEQQNRSGAVLDDRYQQHRLSDVNDLTEGRQDQNNPARMSVDTVSWMILFGDGLLNVIDGLSIGAAFERNILAGISISVAVMLEEVTHRLGTTAILIRTGFSIKQSFICTFLSACALFPGMIIGIVLSDATDEATPYIFCAAGGIFLYTGLVDVMKEMNRSIENAMRKDVRTTLKIFALQNVGIILAVVFLSFLALYEPDFEEYQKILNNN